MKRIGGAIKNEGKNWGALKKSLKNLGSWVSEYNLTITQLDGNCKK